jgi:transcription antitermination factor NusG
MTAAVTTALSPATCDVRWYVARTLARHEKKVAEMLSARAIDSCLPVYDALRRWSDRTVRIKLPLFPGYVFVSIPYKDRLRALEVPGLIGFVKFGDRPAELTDSEARNIQVLRQGLAGDHVAEPFPYLQIGKRVRVVTGAFAGLEGVLKKKKGVDRLVISVHQIQRSVLIEISGAEVHPVCS